MYRTRLFPLFFAALLVVGCQRAPDAPDVAAPLFDGLGAHTMPISTPVSEAQRYFDQGIVLAYGFNHAEAARSFRAAQQLDPECAMCYWGEALVLGPNINAAMNPDDNAAAWAALQKALERSEASQIPSKEKALIQALSHRYAESPPEDRTPLDRAYADAMRPVAAQYPTDPDVQALFAEALMDTTPWDYWEADDSPTPVTEEFTAAIEAALENNLHHPGANHLYIHAVESVHPEKGLAAAERLDGLVPGAGHLVHMPGHIYIRTGRYHDAVRVNLAAAAADERYIAETQAQGFYPLLYYPHNYNFLWFAAMMGGESAVAIETAEKIQAGLSEDMISVERLRPTLTFSLVRFGRWDELLALPAPPEEQLYAQAMFHYARGLAHLHTGNREAAMDDRAALTTVAESDDAQDLEQPFFHGLSQIQIASDILRGETARVTGDHDAAIQSLRAAVAIQDALPYMEPPYWFYPVRQTLGAVLLSAGRFAEAESVYREDLDYFAENGWSLHGLAQSLRAQGKEADAEAVQARFDKAWAHADVQLARTSF